MRKLLFRGRGVKSCWGAVESTAGIFLGRREMSKILTGGGTPPPFSFTSREKPAKLPSNNLSTDAKGNE